MPSRIGRTIETSTSIHGVNRESRSIWLLRSVRRCLELLFIGSHSSKKRLVLQELCARKMAAAARARRSSQGSANQIVFGNRMAEMEIHLKAMANQQTSVIIGMAASFSFVAVGFALFVMGIRSAFT